MSSSTSTSEPLVSVVVPCYLTGPRVSEVVAELDRAFAEISGEWEAVLVDDASPDEQTWPTITHEVSGNHRVVGIQLMSRSGQFAATLCGLSAARGEIIVTMDDDLSHRPDQIHLLISSLTDAPELDAVIATYHQRHRRKHRRMGSWIYRWLLRRAFGLPSDLVLTGFRALRRPLAKALLSHGTRRPQFGALLLQTTKRIKNVEVASQTKQEVPSRYRLRSLVGYSVFNIIEAGTRPMRILTLLGVLAAAASVVLGSVFFALWALGDTGVPGFTSTMLLINFFGGLTMASVGLLAEYVGRIMEEVRGAPVYVERQRVNPSSS